jgi:hypothetical protein
MKINEGAVDRALRAIVGLVLIGLVTAGKISLAGWIGIAILVVGVVLLLTGIVGFCPAYAMFGIKTCTTKKP